MNMDAYVATCATCGWKSSSADESATRGAARVHGTILKPGHVVTVVIWPRGWVR